MAGAMLTLKRLNLRTDFGPSPIRLVEFCQTRMGAGGALGLWLIITRFWGFTAGTLAFAPILGAKTQSKEEVGIIKHIKHTFFILGYLLMSTVANAAPG